MNSLAIIKSPKLWISVHTTTLWTNLSKRGRQDCTTSVGHEDKFYIKSHSNSLFLFIEKLLNTAMIPSRSTEGAAGYDLAATEDTTILAKDKNMAKTGL